MPRLLLRVNCKWIVTTANCSTNWCFQIPFYFQFYSLFSGCIIHILNPHPLPLLRQSGGFAELPILLIEAAQTNASGLGVLLQPRLLERGLETLLLADGALNLPLLLGGLIGGVPAALKLDRRRVDVLQLLVCVGALGDALDKGPIGVTLAAVSPTYAGHGTISASLFNIGGFCHYITTLRYLVPCKTGIHTWDQARFLHRLQ